ncbi:MAG: DndE family protein [Bacilli bacterium]
MTFEIRTSKKTMQIFQQIENSEQLHPFVLSKLAIALSIKSKISLSSEDFKSDNNGLELSRQTITGENDIVYKSLIEMFEKKHLSNDEYFKVYLKAHLDRGAILLLNEQRYSRNFLIHLLNLEKSI